MAIVFKFRFHMGSSTAFGRISRNMNDCLGSRIAMAMLLQIEDFDFPDKATFDIAEFITAQKLILASFGKFFKKSIGRSF